MPRRRRRWRPYLVIAGLVVSFSARSRSSARSCSALLGLPQDVLRWAGIVVLVLIGVGLIVPRFEQLLEKPFRGSRSANVRHRARAASALGLALGAVLRALRGARCSPRSRRRLDRAHRRRDRRADASRSRSAPRCRCSSSPSPGAASPSGSKTFRTHQRGIRIAGGVVDDRARRRARVQRAAAAAATRARLHERASSRTSPTSASAHARARPRRARERRERRARQVHERRVRARVVRHRARRSRGIQQWLNTAGRRSRSTSPTCAARSCSSTSGRTRASTASARSRTSSRGTTRTATRASRSIGIHSPEYAFEKEPRNVAAGIRALRHRLPGRRSTTALSTWTNYRNRYWPAHYLIDADGTVRHISFGEGNYAATEKLIRELLAAGRPGRRAAGRDRAARTTPPRPVRRRPRRSSARRSR